MKRVGIKLRDCDSKYLSGRPSFTLSSWGESLTLMQAGHEMVSFSGDVITFFFYKRRKADYGICGPISIGRERASFSSAGRCISFTSCALSIQRLKFVSAE